MLQTLKLIGNSILLALQELRVNRLRTFLSLLGITIGIFCVISVLTALDSVRNLVQKNVSTLGSDVLYIGRWPWPGSEQGEYKWWDYWRRPSMGVNEARAVNRQLSDVAYTTLCLPLGGLTVKHENVEIGSVRGYAINQGFDKIQKLELGVGRFLSLSELDGGNNVVILGRDVGKSLFPGMQNPVGKSISVLGRRFVVVGVLKKMGQDMANFDYDNSLILPYNAILSVVDVAAEDYDPRLMVKAKNPAQILELKDEVRGLLRAARRQKPSEPDNFAVNQLDGIAKMLDGLFNTFSLVGWFIGAFSLLVGAFGIANIMFVTVRERTRVIGLKKAIGAKRIAILLEFLAESIVLCVIGGLVGILLVVLLSFGASKAFDVEVSLSAKNFVIGVSVSVVVGILSGFIPARSASRLDPVVAIRTN
jgi:putative ABC transport system permease protein